MSNRTFEYKQKYHHALDRMWDLFKYGRQRENDLEKALDLARDEFIRIKNISKNTEIDGLCDRALQSITSTIGEELSVTQHKSNVRHGKVETDD